MENNLDIITVIDGFSYGASGLEEGSNNFVRQGTYRFSIESTNFRK